MQPNPIKQIHNFGQSIWLDFIDRKSLSSGFLQKLIQEDGIRGVTSNPTIFEKAIGGSSDYDEDLAKLVQSDKSDEAIFYELAIDDIRQTADLFQSVYDEEIRGADGYVSLEVSPHLAHDTQGTIEQAKYLWDAVDRKNLMIKIPGTSAGLPAIRHCISEGMNVNVTLLFDLERYEAVTEAYISGLEDRLGRNQPIVDIASVASFFLSRIDTLIDPILQKKGLNNLVGEVAIAYARLAYKQYKQIFNSERFELLATKGAKPQRLLWASTSSKNPAFSDTKYVDALIGPKTVNTLPLETIDAYRDHGKPMVRLENDIEQAENVLQTLAAEGINMDELTQQLEAEGLQKFETSFDSLLNTINKQRQKVPTKKSVK